MFNILSHQGNANRNNSEKPSYSCQNGRNQKHQWQLMLERMGRMGNTSPLLVGVPTCTDTLEISTVPPQEMEMSLPQDPAIPLLGINPNEAHSYNKDICSMMFTESLYVIARTWKQPRCPSTEEWIEKMWYIYTMEYYSAEKNNGFLKFAGKWMN